MRRPRLLELRWLLCGIFIVGYALTSSAFESVSLQYFLLTAVSVAACALLLSQFDSGRSEIFPVGIVLCFLLWAYYGQFYHVVLDPSLTELAGYPPVGMGSHATSAYMTTFSVLTAGFVAFCAAGWALLAAQQKRPRSRIDQIFTPARYISDSTIAAILAVAVAIIVVTTVLVYSLNMVMGMQSVTLPGHIAGITVDLRYLAVPILLIFVILAGVDRNQRFWVIVGAVILVAEALSDMFLRASKSTLPAAALLLCFSWVAGGRRISKRHVTLALLVMAPCIALFPILALLRPLRAYGFSLSSALSTMRALHITRGVPAVDLLRGMLLRVNGAALLLCIVESGAKPLGWSAFKVLASRYGFGAYLTFQVFGAPKFLWGRLFMAPSLIGALYLIGGLAVTVAAMSLLPVLIITVWRLLPRFALSTLPIARAAFLEIVLFECNDGDIMGGLKFLLMCAVALAILEIALRTDVHSAFLPEGFAYDHPV